MGAWGSSLYANDTTSDVRDTYMGFLKEQLSNEEAYAKTLEQFHEYIEDPDEEPLFWYALAESQWKTGRLQDDVKAKALEWIDKGGGMTLWQKSPSGGTGWQKTLDKLKIKLESEQPKERKIRKPAAIDQNPWNMGDVYAYQFHSDEARKNGAHGKYMVLQKIGEESYEADLIMRVLVFDKLFDEVPRLDDLDGLRLLPIDYPTSTRELRMSSLLGLYKKKEYPANQLTFIGNISIPENVINARYSSSSWSVWFRIENWSLHFKNWQGVEYETIEEGIFRYTHPTIKS